MHAENREQYPSPDLISFLQRPDSMIGQRVAFQGRILDYEALEAGSIIILEMDTPWGGMPDEVAVESDMLQMNLAPGQRLKVWGSCLGTYINASENCGITARTHVCADRLEY